MTDTVKHTPSPWQIDRKGLIIKSIGPCIPDEYAGSAWLEVSEADARLISAAMPVPFGPDITGTRLPVN